MSNTYKESLNNETLNLNFEFCGYKYLYKFHNIWFRKTMLERGNRFLDVRNNGQTDGRTWETVMFSYLRRRYTHIEKQVDILSMSFFPMFKIVYQLYF